VAFIPRVKKTVASTPQPKKEKVIFKCVCCGQEKNQDKDFYKSNSIILKANNQRMVVCRQCCIDLYEYLVKKYDDCKIALYFLCRLLDVYFESSLYYSAEQQANNSNSNIALYFLCRLLDVYFESSLYYSAEQQANNSNSNIAQIYFQKVNSLPQYGSRTFSESTPLESDKNTNIFETEIKLDTNEEDQRNKEDVIRMVGYDPFENDNPMDKKYLYNTLVDFLDESTLEDSFKLPIVIEIVKSFNQIDKLNQALTLMTNDISNVQSQVGGVKSLFETKDKIYRAILAMAKDNGISVNHATNKSKGAGTLSGIIKQLQEKGFMEVEVNLFDIETCEGMKQVADISNNSILKQLQFDENDYTFMINEQRSLLQNLQKKNIELEEENRLLKIKIREGGIVSE